MQISNGAEARIYIEKGFVIKKRIPKTYRLKEIDDKLRIKRTKSEVKLLKKASFCAPEVIDFNDYEIKLEHIKGQELKDLIEKNTDLAKELGSIIAKLHSKDIIHGDLTTKNILFDKKIKIIDFGLGKISKRQEDKATDLHIFKESLESEHFEKKVEIWDKFINNYNLKEKEEIIKRLEKIEKRGKNKKK